MEGGIADETSIPPFECECFGSAAQGQPPTWAHVKKGKRGACKQKAATVLPDRTAAT